MDKDRRKCIFAIKVIGGEDKLKRGYFYLWGETSEQSSDNEFGRWTTAVVEDESGQVYEMNPSDIKFEDWE